MASDPTPPSVIGAIAHDRDGNPLGTVTAVYLDDVTEQPTWVGLTPGTHAAPDDDEVPLIAPVTGSQLAEDRILLLAPHGRRVSDVGVELIHQRLHVRQRGERADGSETSEGL